MIDIATFFKLNDRVQIYRPGLCDQTGTCVLYWMQRSQPGYENSALNAAIALGNALELPIVVLFLVTEYPAANLRHYTFMLEGIANVAKQLAQRGTPLVIRRGSPSEEVVRMARELHAAAVISDECEMRTPRAWRAAVKNQLALPFACVDADVVVPTRCFLKEEWAARTLRPKLHHLLPTYLQPIIDLEPAHPLQHPPCDAGAIDNPLSYLFQLQIDRSVEPSHQFHGGQDEGKSRLTRFISERLAGYATHRNLPEITGTSKLSAYLHFGHISIQQSAWEIVQSVAAETGSPLIEAGSGCSAYLEELIVRRELAINFALRNPHYDSLEGCPHWGKETLKKHAADPRQWVYTCEELEQARTHDTLWNASQNEMVITGRMHGYMRMYWAKKILEWTATPEEAFNHAVYLNDKYELDGRDANGYTGAWAIGGKHDRPWGPEHPIFGLVRTMSLKGMQRKMDTRAYINMWSRHEEIATH
ncbi:MAG TPA: deoxyribodipyrimidine photo-lyase [Ktedonobacteraceae bacterium]|nr:deoxyribodipyrimidine photo-lyase [Ktedonobacteraceae bacterium]